MSEDSEQTPRAAEVSNDPFPTYLSVREAARILGVSDRSVYGYVESGKLPGARFGSMVVVIGEALATFQRRAPGRTRLSTPRWRRPPLQNSEYLTTITVRVYPGQHEELERRLSEIRADRKHGLPGTAARYIVRNQYDLDEIAIILVWRSANMPPAEVREDSLTALYADLSDVLNWETASLKESRVLMHA